MKILLVVSSLLITVVLVADLANTEDGVKTIDKFGFQDSVDVLSRKVRDTKHKNARDNKNKRKISKRKKKEPKRKRTKQNKINQKNRKQIIRNRKRKKARDQEVGNSMTKSCQTSSEVDGDCIQNAIDILGFERNQILNFQKQTARISSHNRTANNKMKKRDSFENAASKLLEAVGGNVNSPTCTDTSSSGSSSSLAEIAVENYLTLTNCSSKVSSACSIPSSIYNSSTSTFLSDCSGLLTEFKSISANCRTTNTDNGPAACACWFNANLGMRTLKEQNCDAQPTAVAVKKIRNNCVSVFLKCKKAEDQAVSLVATCGKGEVKTKDGKKINGFSL